MKKSFVFILFLIILLAAVYGGSPYYQAYQLKKAYDNADGAAIAASVDYEQLRPNLKNQLNGKFEATLSQYPLVAQLGGDALTQASAEFINQAVDGAVTPENISTLVSTKGQANQATKELAAAWAIASNQVNLTELIQQLITHRGDVNAVVKAQMQTMMQQQAAELAQQATQGEDSDKPQLSYCGMNCFTLSGQVKSYPLTIEMQRDGLVGWKIVDIELP